MGLETYGDHIKHALANQRSLYRDAQYRQPNWRQTVDALANGSPANVEDLYALVMWHLDDLKRHIGGAATDIYKRFWNEDSYGRVTTPKPEESCRDALADLLAGRLGPLGISIMPEAHMVTDKRADIAVLWAEQKIVIELKRDYHAEVWRAAEHQLDRFYTRDPMASGYGVYGVFWFGEKRKTKIPGPPADKKAPATAKEMEDTLRSILPEDARARIGTIVLDVSVPAH